MIPQAFYDQVADELNQKIVINGLWTRAFAETDGDSNRAKAFYIKLRAAQLSETLKATTATESHLDTTPEKEAQQNTAGNDKTGLLPWTKHYGRLWYLISTLIVNGLVRAFGISDFWLAYWIVAGFLLIPSIYRLHDIGRSGEESFLVFIPVLNIALHLYLLTAKRGSVSSITRPL